MAFILKTMKPMNQDKTIRFPKKLLDRIYPILEKKGISFSSFVIQAVEYALSQMEEEDESS